MKIVSLPLFSCRIAISVTSFIELLWKFLRAGYLESWEYHTTYSGAPQGSGVSPILANIYLNELDIFMENLKREFDRQESYRKPQKAYSQTLGLLNYWKKKLKTAKAENNQAEIERAKGRIKELYAKLRVTPCFEAIDEKYKKIQYLDKLHYVPEIADSWQAQQMIASLIHEMPDVKVVGQIPDSIQKKIDWLESRDKRADELQQITDKLEKGVVEVFQSDRYKQFLDTMAKFPRYSVNNSLLIMMQKPDAQLCQSFTGWKQMGRYVKKGEKGISILAPAPYKIEREQTKLDDKGRTVFDADGESVKEKVEVTIRAFKVVKTFDLSQTDGKELPTIGPSELVGNIEGYPKLLQALQEISPVPVSFELIDGNAKGFYHLEDKKIVVQDGMSEVQTIKTLLHEMAHQKLHDKDNVPEAKDISRNGKEVEAESVAYVVCQHYGINTSDYSFSYVAGWSEGKETPELKASLDKIRQTASEFIYQIDQKMEVLMADKEQVQESAKAPSPFVQELMDKITEGAKDLGFIPVVPETQEKTANPELKVVVDKALKDLDKKRTLSKVKESVKSRLKSNTEKAEQAPRKSRISKVKEERA